MRAQPFILASILIQLAASVWGATVPGRWEKVERLPQGFPIIVKLTSGERYKARFSGLEPETLIIEDSSGSQVELRKEHVRLVTGAEKTVSDPVWEGLLIGAGAGAGIGILPASILVNEGDSSGAAGAVALLAAAGAGVGALLDASVKAREVLYRAPRH